jgi:flagellar assembly protein FliH
MISPSESAGADANDSAAVRSPERLMKPGVKNISRLEFYPLDRPAFVADSESENEIAGAEPLPPENEALVGPQQSQTEQMSARVEIARSEATAEARLLWQAELEEAIGEERSRLQRVEEEFRQQRTKYFAGVESEIVRLALAIATRVLHREAKLDPLLLAGVVKVALEKVAKDSSVVLRVSASEVERWRDAFAANQESALKLVGDERLGASECVLETNVGRVELGVSAQLEEIERGFFDLLQQRPA